MTRRGFVRVVSAAAASVALGACSPEAKGALPSSTIFETFECIGNDVGGNLIGNAEWRVAPLKALLEPLRTDSVKSVRFEALDDHYSSISAARAFDEQAFVAYEMNGDPLPVSHGPFPDGASGYHEVAFSVS